MKKSIVAGCFLAVAVVAVVAAPLAEAKPKSEQMNVLLLIVDDLNTWLLGDTNRYAGKVIAPNIRKLADSGVNSGKSLALNNATSFPLLFKQAGYYTASYGKVEHGWSAKGAWDDQLNHHRDPVPRGAPLSPAGSGKNDWGPTHLKESEMNDTTYANHAIEQLEKKHDKPFFIACGLFHPHMPQYVPQKYLDLFPPRKSKK